MQKLSNVKDLDDFIAQARANSKFITDLLLSEATGLATGSDQFAAERQQTAGEDTSDLNRTIEELYEAARSGQDEAFEELLFIATQSVRCLTHVCRIQPLLAQKYARLQVVWPVFRSGEASLDRIVGEFLEKELALSANLPLHPKSLSTLAKSYFRQLALWLVIYMAYLRQYRPKTVAPGEIEKCTSPGPYSPATRKAWIEAAQYILFSTRQFKDVQAECPKDQRPLDRAEFDTKFNQGIEAAAPLFLRS